MMSLSSKTPLFLDEKYSDQIGRQQEKMPGKLPGILNLCCAVRYDVARL
jgi:hypothetical protein